jgi:hypothetical protein
MRVRLDSIAQSVDLPAATVAGGIAALAYAGEQAADIAVTKHNADDLTLLGRFFVKNDSQARWLGLLIHLANGGFLGGIYAVLAHDRLPGPPWLRGIIFANVENAVLYPIAALEDHHPAIRDGQIDRYWTPVAFAQSIPRHVVYGAVLGSLYARLRRTRPD